VVWCPEYRRAEVGGEVAARLRELVGWRATEHGRDIIAPVVMPGQMHLFVRHGPKASPSYAANQVTEYISHAPCSEFPYLRSRLPILWSKSYFASPAGAVSAESVCQCTGTQYERLWHKGRSR
jgi:putative transposase